jgi:hypothetical protein
VYLRIAGGRGVAEELDEPRLVDWLERTRARFGQQISRRSVRRRRTCWWSICRLSMDEEALLWFLGAIRAVCVVMMQVDGRRQTISSSSMVEMAAEGRPHRMLV